MNDPGTTFGSCLCGGVAFELEGLLRDVFACHCGQCRRSSGHFWAATSVALGDLTMTSEETLAWYRSSPRARRGFCRACGASLFWKPRAEPRMAVAAGAIDGASGLRLTRHIFTGDAGDYYRPEGPPPPDSVGASTRLDCACLCGAVAFTVPGPAGPVTACHCRQCRKLSGHYSASFDVDESGLVLTSGSALSEYVTPGRGRRGFCSRCGSSLWFRSARGEFSVEAGSVTGPTGGRLAEHIFVAAKGDYYAIDDGLPQAAGGQG